MHVVMEFVDEAAARAARCGATSSTGACSRARRSGRRRLPKPCERMAARRRHMHRVPYVTSAVLAGKFCSVLASTMQCEPVYTQSYAWEGG